MGGRNGREIQKKEKEVRTGESNTCTGEGNCGYNHYKVYYMLYSRDFYV